MYWSTNHGSIWCCTMENSDKSYSLPWWCVVLSPLDSLPLSFSVYFLKLFLSFFRGVSRYFTAISESWPESAPLYTKCKSLLVSHAVVTWFGLCVRGADRWMDSVIERSRFSCSVKQQLIDMILIKPFVSECIALLSKNAIAMKT